MLAMHIDLFEPLMPLLGAKIIKEEVLEDDDEANEKLSLSAANEQQLLEDFFASFRSGDEPSSEVLLKGAGGDEKIAAGEMEGSAPPVVAVD